MTNGTIKPLGKNWPHLERYYRSLHTGELKPFEYTDCGKKLSRSDNLSPHQRTHGSGYIVVGVLETPPLPTALVVHTLLSLVILLPRGLGCPLARCNNGEDGAIV
ncbi:hypothetical protein K432DRAFT_410643 [Lepidopterella palustris CBS 459.81]|uniref:C2H2-type domain-containing protein n=1 Tax=Lepidopterella palustris CBS 459.81 TaxID=1314670 RepID=A0A8E2J8Q8_9PEZI|nr:hypothetical protein K432DRAFT_410643 [Lepidopterella palustris CBS 459.81]